ncbi:Beta-catenin-like protein 1 [Schistosoma japonicum]|nr:Beta-catenin-like protein 1 [Schistosoma japonicum]
MVKSDCIDLSRSFNAPDSWNSETSNEFTTVGANEETETSVCRLTVLFEKRSLSNQEARTKYKFSVIDLLHELLESTCLQEAGLEKVNKFLEVLFPGQLIQSLMQNISRLGESKKDEADGVHKTLG